MPLPPPTGLSPEVFALLACPACHGLLLAQRSPAILCIACGRVYPVRDGIPVLIVAEANLPDAPKDMPKDVPAHASAKVPVYIPLGGNAT